MKFKLLFFILIVALEPVKRMINIIINIIKGWPTVNKLYLNNFTGQMR